MTTTLWDTTGTDVVNALIAERRNAGAVASGAALSLIVVADEKQVDDAAQAATVAAAQHPCRLLIVVRRKLDSDDRLDAEISVGGTHGPTEAVVMRMYGRLTLHAESVILPLLAPDAPVVTWWFGVPPDRIAYDPLGVLAARRVTDCAAASDPMAALHERAADFAPGDTDLAWTRTTPWRSLLASAFDATPNNERPQGARAVIESAAGNPSAALLAGWLRSRLGCGTELAPSEGPGITSVTVTCADGSEIAVNRPDGRSATMSRTGQPDRTLPLPRRSLGDLLAEELRRLETDPVYAAALAAATAVGGGLADGGLADGTPVERTHIWRDPAEQAAAGEQGPDGSPGP